MVAPSLKSRGGISAVAGRLLSYLRDAGFRVRFIGSRVEGPRLRSAMYTVLSYFRFAAAVLRLRPSLIHVHVSENLSFIRKHVYVYLAMLLRRRVVLHVHPDRFVEYCARAKPWLRFLLKRVFRYVEAVIVLSERTRGRLVKLFPETPIFVLSNPVDTAAFRCGSRPTGREVLYMGWFIPEKGVYDLLEVIPEAARRAPGARFVFCGVHQLERLRAACSAPELKSLVDIKGWVEGEEKVELLSRAAMLVLPSYTEGFPNVVLEAMASCLPVVTTPVGANPEILKQGINGFFHEPGDRDGLREHIVRLLLDPDLGREMGRRNRTLAESRFDILVIGKKLTEIYDQVTARN